MNNRQKELLDKLKILGHISVVGQSRELHVTEMTIRRDLQLFEKLGLATRVHGGAIPRSQQTLGVEALMHPASDGQIRIAKLAIQQLAPGSVVMLNTGTTVLQVAREIAAARIPLTIVTNSLPVAVVLYQSECQVLITGGTLRRQALDLAGPITEKNLDEYHVDTLIAGCDGADSSRGFFTRDISLAEMERKSVAIAQKVVIVTEAKKFEQPSLAKFADTKNVSLLITDHDLPVDKKSDLERAGVKIAIA